MRGKRAKELRKVAYGDKSLRGKRKYTDGATLVNTGTRGRYQYLKNPDRRGILFEVHG